MMTRTVLPVLLCLAFGLEAQETKPPADAQPGADRSSQTAGSVKPTFTPGAPADPAAMAAPGSSTVKANAAGPVDPKAYIIGAKDVLAILVWNQPEFGAIPHVVRPDGRISLPYIGEVQAAGRTPEQLRADIAQRLTEQIREPNVTVSVSQVNSRKFFIQGEVLRPGEFDLIVPTTVLQGLVQAGGFKEFANQKKITVLRGDKIMKFNYKDVIQGKHREQNVLLEPGDIIVVK
jgi:polysaccharide export outer membrane protein